MKSERLPHIRERDCIVRRQERVCDEREKQRKKYIRSRQRENRSRDVAIVIRSQLAVQHEQCDDEQGENHQWPNPRRQKLPRSQNSRLADLDARHAGTSTLALRSSFPQPTMWPRIAATNERSTTQYMTCLYAKRCRNTSQVRLRSSPGSARNAITAATQSTARKTA